MTQEKQDKVTEAGAVSLEESQLDDVQGGITYVKIDFGVSRIGDGSVNKIVDGTSNIIDGTSNTILRP